MAAVFKAIEKARLLTTALLCVVVLAASVDRLPDPPALKPSRSEVKSSGLKSHFYCAYDEDGQWAPVVVELMYPEQRFDFGSILKTAHPVRRASLVRQFSDSSPPDLAV